MFLLQDCVAAGRHARARAHVVRRDLHDVVAELRRLARGDRHAALREDDAEREHHEIDVALVYFARRNETALDAAEARKRELHLRLVALLHEVERVSGETRRFPAPRREAKEERAAKDAEAGLSGAKLRPETPLVVRLRTSRMEILVLFLVVRFLKARQRLEARFEHRAVSFLALRRDFEREVREHRL